jgi:ABC-type Fe2+-enterobactin transport system substrate-binding protein
VASDEVKAAVLVLQTVIPTELVRISSPSFKSESFELFPSTGSSRFATQTTVEFNYLLNHMAKQNALSPTRKNPAEYSPFVETNMSLGLSTVRDVPLRVSSV